MNELAERPEVPVDLWPYLEAWVILSRARPPGRAPVPVSEILAFLDVRRIMEPELRREYAELVTALDHEYLRLTAAPD